MRIAVDGASGYQGGLAVAELTRRGIGTVLVGRDAARLREAAARLEVLDTERRVARWDDHGALATAFGGCEAVVNCAGPFTPSGHAVVHAAITAGCHYLDTAGEQLYIKKVFDRFAADADRAGVTIIPAATDGAVPSDLIAHILAKLIEPVAEITTAHTIDGGGPSRGSLRSVLETVETFKAGGLGREVPAARGRHDSSPCTRRRHRGPRRGSAGRPAEYPHRRRRHRQPAGRACRGQPPRPAVHHRRRGHWRGRRPRSRCGVRPGHVRDHRGHRRRGRPPTRHGPGPPWSPRSRRGVRPGRVPGLPRPAWRPLDHRHRRRGTRLRVTVYPDARAAAVARTMISWTTAVLASA